jgi:signal transduction histidine kinase
MRYFLIFVFSFGMLLANEPTVKIGVLAKRGHEVSHRKWDATAQYLSQQIPQYSFEIIPINFEDIFDTVAKEKVDFILANSGYYVVLESQYGAQRITTLVNKHITGLAQKEFGGVLFTHIDNKDRFNTIKQIKGTSFGAVNENSLGGWQMAWRELVENDIDKDKDLASLAFFGTHDKVVYSVLNKQIEVGNVRTDTLERMALEEKIDLNKIHIIAPKSYENFPFLISTKLYPEWPLAKLKHTSDELSKQVAIALMQMSSSCEAALKANIDGWNTPLSYQPVHACFKILEIPPYYQPIEFWKVIDKYKFWIVFYLFGAIAGVTMLVYQVRLTSFLKRTQNELVQTEKMAALGRLVAGIAHEVNTPIGIGVTAASHLKKEIKNFNEHYLNESLSKNSFEEFIDTSTQSSDILLNNLERAANIIQNFKQVSVDQSSDTIRNFFLKEYLDSIVINLKPSLKQSSPLIEILCPKNLQIESNPGAFYQIFTNLIMNSVIHGFEEKENGHIIIEVHQKGNDLEIIYKDNGKGMSKENLDKVFDPFFTTRRSLGGSGLGTHIIYNLVTQKLHGTITAKSEKGKGLTFIMYFKGIKHV